MTVDNDEFGAHLVAGQAWTLATMNLVGIVPRTENTPLVIGKTPSRWVETWKKSRLDWLKNTTGLLISAGKKYWFLKRQL